MLNIKQYKVSNAKLILLLRAAVAGGNKLLLDSRKISHGDVFFALGGKQQDGCEFMQHAISNGAKFIVADSYTAEKIGETGQLKASKELNEDCCEASCYVVDNLIEQLPNILEQVYVKVYAKLYAEEIKLIGVTGTNGKTSTTYFLSDLLSMSKLQQKVSIIGTTGWGNKKDWHNSELTTPDIFSLHYIVQRCIEQGSSYIVMEVSSHALHQNRLGNLPIYAAIFSNLTQDHLDYHSSMQDYFNCKFKLLQRAKKIYLNLDNYGKQALARLVNAGKQEINLFKVGEVEQDLLELQSNKLPYMLASNLVEDINGIKFDLSGSWGKFSLYANVIGKFNIENLLPCISIALQEGVSSEQLSAKLQTLQQVPGRMEVFGEEFKVVVDYSHTPDALHKALLNLKSLCTGKLMCVFGCGGQRDTTKRPLMGMVAAAVADFLIITNDNPRGESPEKIAQDIIKGISAKLKVNIILSREDAIAYAIRRAKPGDIVLVAGKGHENYQILADKIIKLDDRDIVERELEYVIKIKQSSQALTGST